MPQTSYEQYMLELVNRARLDPAAEATLYGVSLGAISAASKQPLAENPFLTAAAQNHSQWMLDTDIFSHTGAGGSSAGTRMTNAGYVFSGNWTWGENIAWQGTTGTLNLIDAIDAAHESLFQSDGHRANILNDSFQEVGIGIRTGVMTGYNAAMVTQDFAKSGSGGFLLGVAYTDTDADGFYSVGEGRGGVAVAMQRIGGATTTVTTAAPGGYQSRLADGDYAVTFSGGGLPAALGMTVTMAGRNIKIDLIGTDTVASSASLIMGANLVGLELLGTENLAGTGNTLANAIAGNKGANRLDGAAGADTLTGGAGNDVFVLKTGQSHGDVVADFTGNGAAAGDSIQFDGFTSAAVLQSLGGNQWQIVDGSKIESFTIVGALAASDYSFVNVVPPAPPEPVTGTAGDDTLIGTGAGDILGGGDGNDEIYGLGGNDTLFGGNDADWLDGGTGADSMSGAAGDDTYVMDVAGDAIDESGGGNDTVRTPFTIDLTMGALTVIENAVLLGIGAINAFGNGADNQLTGNSAANVLDGRGGADTMIGGAGNDTYCADDGSDDAIEDPNGGVDLVKSTASYVLAANVENLTLLGAAKDGTGNALANVITGNNADNRLDGAGGADKLIGGLGNDTYVIDLAADVITETANAGTDTVEAAFTYTLALNFENLTLAGSGDINGTGNAVNNVLTGNSGANLLDGKAGADSMAGGGGNDIYIVDGAGDQVSEGPNAGIDEIRSTIALTAAAAHVENYSFLGTLPVHFSGNGLDNRISGTAAADILSGAAGNDTLIGGAGIDNLSGGSGNDTYVIDSLSDKISEGGADAGDTVQAALTLDLSLANFAGIENAILTGIGAINAMGTGGANKLTGNDGANVLDGRGGADNMAGGKGNDTYVVDHAGDSVAEIAGGGIDTVKANIDYVLADPNLEKLVLLAGAIAGTGNALANAITGNDAANQLDGGAGTDTLVGGAGNDVFIVDVAGDVITELAAGGFDTVKSTAAAYTLGAYVEDLVLLAGAGNGTGNALANRITGNGADNILDGKAGADVLEGGGGNDVYVIDVAGDQVIEAGADADDEVRSAFGFGGVIAGIEHYSFTGAAAVDFAGDSAANRIAGTGAADTLSGGAGNDTLNGGLGSDSMIGGIGDDRYVVNVATDKVNESNGDAGDLDTVESGITFSLVANGTTLTGDVEHLVLTGAAIINGTGNGLDNRITGNGSANLLTGNGGNDTLDGGAGNDTLVGGAGNDAIDVSAGNDTVRILSTLDGTDVVTGFDGDALGGQDVLNLDGLFDSLGVAAAARAGRLSIDDQGASVNVLLDADGNGSFESVIATINSTDAITVGADVIVGT